MLTIRVRKKKIKVVNFLIFILFVSFIIYMVFFAFFSLPFFNKSFTYNINLSNYKLSNKTTFKTRLLTCKIKEEVNISSSDKIIKKALNKDLTKDGFKLKNDKYVRTIKRFGFCTNEKDKYVKYHKKGYVKYKLKGNDTVKLKYKDNYDEKYITFKINNKTSRNVYISSNLNTNKIGTYLVKYKLNLYKDNNIILYRKIIVYDDEKPVIKLNGEDKITITYGSYYNEEGFSATDNYDGNITNKVIVKDDINTKKNGTYKISYKVSDSSNNVSKVYRTVVVTDEKKVSKSPNVTVKDGITYIDGILIVNKEYSLPKNYNPGVNEEALKNLKQMQADAKAVGLNIPLISGYRSYETQEKLYKKYVLKDGEKNASTYSAKAGNSEHQTGLAFDIGSVDRSFEGTDEAKWISENAHLYGFIVRYPKGKTSVTGYIYEPWHVRYLGKKIAKKVYESKLTLEEYLNIN